MANNFSPAVTPIAALRDNYIWLLHPPHTASEHGQACQSVAIVDPGDARTVITGLKRLSLQPCAILVTHNHYDHVDGIAELLNHYRIPVYGPAFSRIPGLSHPLQDNDHIVLANGLRFSVIATPGHTQDHICYASNELLLSGDTLFAAGCGRLLDGSAQQMYDSLMTLADLPGRLNVCCTHEYTLSNLTFAIEIETDNQALIKRLDEVKQLRSRNKCTLPSTLAVEKATNPFLRCNEPAIRKAAQKYSGRTLNSGVEVFAVIRYWKDTF